jgi:hypothetical protein
MATPGWVPQFNGGGGTTPGCYVSASGTNATVIKNSPGILYLSHPFNTNASARYVKLFDKATAPVPGTDTPVFTFGLPGSSTGAGSILESVNGMQFKNGISFAITANPALLDNTGVSANDVVFSYTYI